MSKLKEVTERICELLHMTALEMPHHLSIDICSKSIRLDEVLMALKTLLLRPDLDGLAKLFHDNDGNKALLGLLSLWQLGKPLSDQSENTINFLHTILNQTP